MSPLTCLVTRPLKLHSKWCLQSLEGSKTTYMSRGRLWSEEKWPFYSMQGSPGAYWGFDHRWTWLRIRFGMKIRGEYSGECKGDALLWTKWGFGGVVSPLTRSPRFFYTVRFSIKFPFQRCLSRPRTAPMTSRRPPHAIFGIRIRYGTTITLFLEKVDGVDLA